MLLLLMKRSKHVRQEVYYHILVLTSCSSKRSFPRLIGAWFSGPYLILADFSHWDSPTHWQLILFPWIRPCWSWELLDNLFMHCWLPVLSASNVFFETAFLASQASELMTEIPTLFEEEISTESFINDNEYSFKNPWYTFLQGIL